MQYEPTAIPEVVIVQPTVHGDDRGFFFEAWNQREFAAVADVDFVQDNHSGSVKDVLRGLHYQIEPVPQGKLVRVAAGAVWDVAVDIRRTSPTFKQWVGVELSADNRKQLWVPPGFAHGFLTLSDQAEVLYKTTAFYSSEHDRSLAWDDPVVGVEWPLDGRQPVLSQKDRSAPQLGESDLFA